MADKGDVPAAPAPEIARERYGWGVAAIQPLGLFGGIALFAVAAGDASWSTGPLVAIAVLAVASDLTSVPGAVGKARISGTALGLMLAAVLLGGAPAAAVGMLTILIGWFRWRESPPMLLTNFVVYLWFPLLSGMFFHAVTHVLQVTSGDSAYYLIILPTFVVGLLINFIGVTAHECYRIRASLGEKLRDHLGSVLAAELFSAVLLIAAVFFVVKTGTVGIALLALILAIFQYLVGELLKSRQRADELRRKATTDELTGLANREHFSAVLAETITSARLSGEPFAVMLIDLDHFKEINDTLGHHYGDLLLRDLGPRLAESAGEGGLVARLGGDEFAVLPHERTDDPEQLEDIATRLLACVQEPLAVDDLALDVGASIGIARFPKDGEDVHDLLRRADVAMYSAKEKHSNIKLYSTKLDRHSKRRLAVLSDFRRSLDAEHFVLHFQP